MSPEYLYELAALADPNELWRQGGLTILQEMPEEQRRQLDTGVALRRYAAHIAQLRRALSEKKSVLITPISLSGTTGGLVETPPNHQRLRDCRSKAVGSETQPGLSITGADQAMAQALQPPTSGD